MSESADRLIERVFPKGFEVEGGRLDHVQQSERNSEIQENDEKRDNVDYAPEDQSNEEPSLVKCSEA